MDYRKKSALFFNIGLVLSLLIVISAFEWKFVETTAMVFAPTTFIGEETELIEITEINPPKPKIKVFTLIEVEEDEVIDIEDIEVDFDAIEVDKIEDIVAPLEPDIEIADEIISIAETMPSFEGGITEFYKFIGKHLKYPAQARRMNIEGKVFVYFVVDKDGSLSDIKVVRGIGAGCDVEVLRIINKSPKWNPGKQRGVPVRVRMMLPITFKLQ